jgi:hypothetical protein
MERLKCKTSGVERISPTTRAQFASPSLSNSDASTRKSSFAFSFLSKMNSRKNDERLDESSEEDYSESEHGFLPANLSKEVLRAPKSYSICSKKHPFWKKSASANDMSMKLPQRQTSAGFGNTDADNAACDKDDDFDSDGDCSVSSVETEDGGKPQLYC